jgi:hypothetical protein
MITWIPLESLEDQMKNVLPPDVQDVFVYYQVLESEEDETETRYQISVGYFSFINMKWYLSTGTDAGDTKIKVTHWAPLAEGILPNKYNTTRLTLGYGACG